MIGGASCPPALVSQESPLASKTSPVPSQDMRRGLSRVWSAVEEQLVGERRRVVAIVTVVVAVVVAAAAVVVASLGAVVGSVERSTCWKEWLVSSSIFGHARPSPG